MDIHKPEDAFSLCIRTLKLFGAWPYAVNHPFLRFIYNLYGYCLQIFYISVLLPQLINLYVVRSNLENLIDSSFVTLTCMAYLPKIILIISRGKKIKEFLKKLRNPIFSPQTKEQFIVLEKYKNLARQTSFVFILMCSITATIWAITPLVQSNKKKELLLASWYPYNTSVNPMFAYTYSSQAFLLINTACVNSMMDTMITNFYILMVGQIEILKMDFKQVADIADKSGELFLKKVETKQLSNSKETMSCQNYLQTFNNQESLDRLLNKRIIKCTEHYREIIKYVNDVTNFFEIGIVSQMCASSIVICTATYEMTLISLSSIEFYVIMQYQICMLVEIFLYCYRGHDFTIKAAELKDAVYESAWMSVPNMKFRKSLCIIMSPLHIPVRLVVGKFFVLSLDTFFKIIKMAYSFYILLKQFNNPKK